MAKFTVIRVICRCERCGYEWEPRKQEQEPHVCPKCKSAYWNTPKRNKTKTDSGGT